MLRDLTRIIQQGERRDSARERVAARPELGNMVRAGDARDLIKELPDESVDLIITDPPFGVLEDSLRDAMANTRAAGGLSYHDKPEDILKLLQDLAPELYRVLVPNSHLYLFCTIGAKDPKHPERYASFQNIALAMAEAGFAVRPGPLLWVKDMAYGFTPAPDSQHPYCYEGCLFARKGSRSFNGQPELDYWLIEPQTRGREHIAQKPSSLWYEVFKHSYVKDGVFLDCFCGSGGSLVTATELGMSVIGFDKYPNSIALTTDQLGEAIERKKSQDKLIVEKEEQDG